MSCPPQLTVVSIVRFCYFIHTTVSNHLTQVVMHEFEVQRDAAFKFWELKGLQDASAMTLLSNLSLILDASRRHSAYLLGKGVVNSVNP